MPPNPQRAAKPSRPHPYRTANPPPATVVLAWEPTRQANSIPNVPPPHPKPDRGMSAIGLIEESMKKAYPGFVWKNDMELIIACSPSFEKPKDNATLRRRLDEQLEKYKQTTGMDPATDEIALALRNTKRTEVLGTKPNVGQRTKTLIIPSCPSISVRLWTSSPSLKKFCMDFVETETGSSVDAVGRFKVYGDDYMVSGGPKLLLSPPSSQEPVVGPSGESPAQGTYLLNECQAVTIEDTKSKHEGDDRFLSFNVPTYPVQGGHITHFSFDE